MELQQLREEKKLTRKELAERTGISFRSIQDYEQGHKDLASAKGSSLYKLSLALGCTVEDLIGERVLDIEMQQENPKEIYNRLTRYRIEMQKIYDEKYKIAAKWVFKDNQCYLRFMYDGEVVQLPFSALFTKDTIMWLVQAAMMQIESYVEEVEFNKQFHGLGGKLWDET